MKRTTWFMLIVFAMAAMPAFAQTNKIVQHDRQVLADKLGAELAQTVAKMTVLSHVTKGAPYTAETVTESVQTLADGNRIVNKTSTRVYRDGEGRTRTEHLTDGQPTSVSISDPVSGVTYMLSPSTHTAFQNSAVIVTHGEKIAPVEGGVVTSATSSAGGTVRIETRELSKADAEKRAAEVAAKTSTFTFASPSMVQGGQFVFASHEAVGNTTKEELGEQLIEGVMATGTRATTIIAAGAIGNEQPIRIVSEEWTSKELGILVMTKYSNPRTGETTYRVININRTEPDPTLFQVPGDYKVQRSMIRRESR